MKKKAVDFVTYFSFYNTMAEISISIENKYVGGEHKVRALKKQFLGIILCFLCIEMAMAIASL